MHASLSLCICVLYQLEVARVAERKARRAALTPTRVQPARAGKRARAS
jgi:hypothetical protein